VAEFSEKLVDIRGNEKLEELLVVLRENFDTIQRIFDGLTGQRLESWTPIRRDGQTKMTGNLELRGGQIRVSSLSAKGENMAGLRRDKNGYWEYSHDCKTWLKLPIKAGSPDQVMKWSDSGDLPEWSNTSALAVDVALDPTFADVTGSRVIGTTYQNTATTMKVVQISITLSA
jgi:hypothetical protein